MATVGPASTTGMMAAALARAARIELLAVPYKGGAPGVQAMLAGEVDATFTDLATVAPHVASGALRLVATAGRERSPLAPGVPTLPELGYTSIGEDPWYGLVAPAGTPARVVDTLSALLRDAVRDDDLRSRFRALGYAPFDETPAAFASALGEELARARATLALAVNK
jgi:tripartite-type tricarboxylate transporter receptor subunit TctC